MGDIGQPVVSYPITARLFGVINIVSGLFLVLAANPNWNYGVLLWAYGYPCTSPAFPPPAFLTIELSLLPEYHALAMAIPGILGIISGLKLLQNRPEKYLYSILFIISTAIWCCYYGAALSVAVFDQPQAYKMMSIYLMRFPSLFLWYAFALLIFLVKKKSCLSGKSNGIKPANLALGPYFLAAAQTYPWIWPIVVASIGNAVMLLIVTLDGSHFSILRDPPLALSEWTTIVRCSLPIIVIGLGTWKYGITCQRFNKYVRVLIGFALTLISCIVIALILEFLVDGAISLYNTVLRWNALHQSVLDQTLP